MNPNDYVRAAMRTECDQLAALTRFVGPTEDCEFDLKGIRLDHAFRGISKEAGELLTLFEKWIHYGQTLDPAKVKDELGDVLWYVALACDALGLDLGEVMASNVRKLKVRFPDKYTDNAAKDRDRAAEAAAMDSPNPYTETARARAELVIQDGHGFGHVVPRCEKRQGVLNGEPYALPCDYNFSRTCVWCGKKEEM